MAASFKIPTPIRKPKKDPGLPKFEWKLFEKEKKLGSGTFGSVYLGKYEGKCEKVVTKKINGESIDSQARFVKEALLLNSAKGHRNVIEFLGFSNEPYAIMMEYSSFDFRPFGVEKNVCSLEGFVHFVDAEFDFTSFADLLPVCTKDYYWLLPGCTGSTTVRANFKRRREIRPCIFTSSSTVCALLARVLP